MQTNAAGIALIKEFEDCKLEAYQDEGGIWTIGWGSTHQVPLGVKISQQDADAMLQRELCTFEGILEGVLPAPHLSENQFSALICFCYNVGFGAKGVRDGFCALKTGEPSTMLKRILQNDFANAAQEFPKWVHIGRKTSAGLLRRRTAEQALFLKAD